MQELASHLPSKFCLKLRRVLLLYRFMSCGVRLGSRSYHIVPVPEDRIKMVNASLNTALKAVIMIVYD